MLGLVHAFDFLSSDLKKPDQLPALVAIYGDEPFLKQLTLSAIKRSVERDGDAPIASWEASEARWADISDELLTPSLFGSGHQIVIVRQADAFVTAFRPQLEDYVAGNPQDATLVLELNSWPGNTRLAKAVSQAGLAVTCRAPQRKSGKRMVSDQKALLQWIGQHAKQVHALQLTARQVELVFELVGENLGLIDGELAKLALFADQAGALSDKQVLDVVGGWRTQSTWELLDKVCQGDAAGALAQLDRLIQSGEHPQALFGAFSWSLRRFAAAVRIVEAQETRGQRANLSSALAAAGVNKFPKDRFDNALAQLRQIGRRRGQRLYRRLLDADLKMKRSHSSPHRARFVLEELIFELSSALSTKRSA
jgi:DNA polymerase-3 subunit delta